MTSMAGRLRLTAAEQFWYVLQCIAFGAGYFAKVSVKKALSEVGLAQMTVSIRKSCERACQQPTWPFTMAAPVRALFAQGYPGAGGGCAQVRRSSGLAFQGRNRSSAIPVRGLPPLRPHSSR